jgi:ATP synthase protein I
VTETTTPEHVMVRRAVILGAVAVPLAFGAGALVDGADGGWSALLGVAVVVANFAVHGLSLAWAAGISIPMLQVVALAGFVGRMAVIVMALVLLDRTAFFSPAIFGVAAVGTIIALLSYEARLLSRGLGGNLQIPPEPAAAAAGEALRAREEAGR